MANLASVVALLQMVVALLSNPVVAHTNQAVAITSQAVQIAEEAEGPLSAAASSSAATTLSAPAPPSSSVPRPGLPFAAESGGVSISYSAPAPTASAPYLTWSNFSVPIMTVAEEEATTTFPIEFPLDADTNVTGTFFLYSGDDDLFAIDADGGSGSILENLDPEVASSYPLTIGIDQGGVVIATATAVLTPTYPDDCAPNPCENGGSCSEGIEGASWDGFTCACPSGYGGTECQTSLTPTIVFGPLTAEEGDDPFVLSPSSTSDGAFTFSNDSSSVATISGDTVTVVGAGETIVTAMQAASGSYLSCVATTTLTVSPGACETGVGVCDNEGTCIDGPSNTYSCSCPPCYSGPTCDQFNFVECA